MAKKKVILNAQCNQCITTIFILSTVKSTHAVTSIKQLPVFKGHNFLVLS